MSDDNVIGLSISALSRDELEKAADDLEVKVRELRMVLDLLLTNIEGCFIAKRGERRAGYLTLLFSEREVDGTLWLAGTAIDHINSLEQLAASFVSPCEVTQ